MLKVRGLAVPGLAPIDLDLDAGECVALTGPSGSGKTLILRALADLDPGEGRVELDGRRREHRPAPAWRRRVSYLAAEPGWWADTVGEHFDGPGAVLPLLSEIQLSPRLLDQPIATVSTGERQRLAFVRMLLLAPAVMLLDEPTAALDDEAARYVEAILAKRLGGGAAMLLVTHDPAQADRLAHRRMRLADGRLEPAAHMVRQ